MEKSLFEQKAVHTAKLEIIFFQTLLSLKKKQYILVYGDRDTNDT